MADSCRCCDGAQAHPRLTQRHHDFAALCTVEFEVKRGKLMRVVIVPFYSRVVIKSRVVQIARHDLADDPGPDEPPPDDEHIGAGDGHKSQESSDTEHEPTTWEPVDLGPYLRGEVQPPQQTVGLARSDGIRFLYDGRENVVIGETESSSAVSSVGVPPISRPIFDSWMRRKVMVVFGLPAAARVSR